MDGSNEHQGHLQLLQMPNVQLREMLDRQERLQASGILDRTPDGGAKARALMERLRELLKQRESEQESPSKPIEDRSPQTLRFLPFRPPPPPSRPLPSPPPCPSKTPEDAQEEELSRAVAALKVTDPESPSEVLDLPSLAQPMWDANVARFAPSRPRPGLCRQPLPPSARLVLLDLLPDPCQPSRLLQAGLMPITTGHASTPPQVLFCQPAFLAAPTSRQSGLSVRPGGDLWLEGEEADEGGRKVTVVAEEEALLTIWETMIGDEVEGGVLVLLLPPGLPSKKAELWSLLGRATRSGNLQENCLLLELGCTEWNKQIADRLSQLRRPLSTARRLSAVRDFLSEDPQRLSPARLAEAGRVVRVTDRLALADWLSGRAQRQTAFRRRLAANAGLMTAEEAEKLANEGWHPDDLLRAAAAGWEGFACALLGPWSAQPVAEERVNLTRRLFRRLRAKFERLERQRETLLPRNEPLVALLSQRGPPKREACALTLRESLTLMQRGQSQETAQTSLYLRPQFMERRERREEEEEEEKETDEEDEEETESDDDKDMRLSDAD